MADMIGACLSSLISLDYPKDRYEIIVIDGGSTDGTLKICKDFGVQCFIEKKRGRGLARNAGVKKAKGEIIAFIDADCKAYKNWLSIHVSNHSDKTIGAVTGSVIDPYLVTSTKSAIMAHYVSFAEFDEALKRNYTYHAPTCNTSFKRSVLQVVNFFYEELDAYEDFLLSRKITDAGYKILFEPQAKILHFGIRDDLKFESYLRREWKNGEAHFKAQAINKNMFGRIPMNPLASSIFAPSIMMARIARESYKLLRIPNFARHAITCIPYLLSGGFVWSCAYVKMSFSQNK
jgi:glycosyltransferase involved in cell wall biosynthesis